MALPVFLTAQEHYTYELLNQESLASFGPVYDLYQDSTGIIWLGHFGKGLSFYNGKKISRFQLKNEGAFASKTNVFIEAGGLLYLNFGDQVKAFDPIRQELVDSVSMPTEVKNQPPLSSISIEEISGDIWAVQILETKTKAANGVYTTFDLWRSTKQQPFEKITPSPLRTFGTPILKFYQGRCFVKGEQGLLEIRPSGKTSQEYPLNWMLDLQELHTNNTVLDTLGRFWFTIHTSFDRPLELYFLHLATGQIQYVYSFPIYTRDQDKLLVPEALETLKMRGDFLFLNAQHQFNWKIKINRDFARLLDENTFFTLKLIKDILTDKTGLIFIGHKFGLGKLMQQPPAFKLIPRITVRDFVEDEQGLLYGSIPYLVYGDQVGITVYDPQKDSVSWIDLFPLLPFWYSALYKDRKIYFGNMEFDLNTHSLRTFNDPEQKQWNPFTILQLLVDDQIWSIRWESDHIEIYERESLQLVKSIEIPSLMESKVDLNDIYLRPSDSTIWLGTFGKGLFVFSKAGEQLHHLTSDQNSKTPLLSNTVSGFYEDSKQNMWIGQISGLSRIAPGFAEIEHFLIDPDNPDYYLVYGILPEDDDNFLWLSTNRGIFRFDVQQGTFLDFPLNPYVMEAEYNRTSFHKSTAGRMYFSGTYERNHTVAFYPKEVVDYYQNQETGRAPIIFTQFSKLEGRMEKLSVQTNRLNLLEKVTLQPDDRYFSLEFLLTDFRSPENIFYTYYLHPYESDWNTPKRGNNQIKYENLPPGKYTLKMRASLTRQNLPLNERHLSVTVLPYWYQTWWARSLFVLLLAGTAFYFVRRTVQRQLELQENKRLRDLDQFKTRLYTNITHEFRTPLTIILGMNDQIQGNDKERGLIRRSAQNLLQLINQLLDLSKLDSGKLQVEMIRGDIVPYISYLCDSFYSLALDKNISLQTHFPKEALIMEYDEEKIRHIISNLLSNAIKFTPPGKYINLQARTCTLAEQDWLELKVEDAGIGISATALPHIFERFYQGKKENVGGTGIGLALTKELVELLDGTIEVESTLGQGTTFTILLPINNRDTIPVHAVNKWATPHPAHATIAIAAPALQTAPTESNKPLVLIVEDTPGVVSYLQALLQEDYEILVAIDGQAGVEQAIAQVPDLIITDVMMPKKNGFELCNTLKRDERTSHIPIIMLTAKADIDSRVEGLEMGADAYLPKPFEKKELFVRIRKLLELRQVLQQRYATFTKTVYENAASDTPQSPPGLEEEFLQKLIALIEARLTDAEITIPEISQLLAMSHTQLYRKLKAITGKTPSQFIRSVRLQKAKHLLKTSRLNVSEVAYEVGFTGPQYFSKMFKEEFGYPPSEISEK